MTFRDKLRKERPDRIREDALGGCVGCPNDYGYEPYESRPCECDDEEDCISCEECWSREIPGEHMRKLPKGFIEVVESGWNIKHLINVRYIERVAPSSNEKCYLYMATVSESSTETRFYEAAHSYDEVIAMIKEALE